MKIIGMLVFTLLLTLTPNLASSGEANLKFLVNKNLLGMKAAELEKLIGAPLNKIDRGCKVPTGPEGSVAFGEAWFYAGETKDLVASLSICLMRGVVVDTLKKSVLNENGVLKRVDEEVISLPLIKELSKEVI